MTVAVLLAFLATAVLGYYAFGRSVTAPPVLLGVFMAIALTNGLMNYSNWSYDLSANTGVLLIAIALTFYGSCAMTRLALSRTQHRGNPSEEECSALPTGDAMRIEIPFGVVMLGLAFTITVFVLYANKIVEIAVANGGDGGLLSSAFLYDRLSKFSSTDVSIRGILGQSYTASFALSIFWGYVASNNLAVEPKRIDAILWVNLILGMAIPLLTGGRAGSITLVTATALMYLMAYTRAQRSDFQASRAHRHHIVMGLILGMGVAGVAFFMPIAHLFGRSTGTLDAFGYLSMYLGAPLKNLDSYLSGTLSKPIEAVSNGWGQQTFVLMRESLAHWGLIPTAAKQFTVWQPYQSINGTSLGNVYTLFYPLVFDFGELGAVIAMMLVGIVSTVVHECAMAPQRFGLTNQISICAMAYGVIGYGLIFAFFSNRLFSAVVSSTFVGYMFVWMVCKYTPTAVSVIRAHVRGCLPKTKGQSHGNEY